MRTLARRRALWLSGVGASALLAWSFLAAGADGHRLAPLLVGFLGLVVLALIARASIRGLRWDDGLHASGVWLALSVTRAIALLAFFAFIATTTASIILSSGARLYEPWTLAFPAVAALVCACGFAIELVTPVTSRRAHVVDPTPRARVVYRGRSGGVVTAGPGGAPWVVGPEGRRRGLSEIERAIDQRRWSEGTSPGSDELLQALERWGTLRDEG